MIVYALLPDGGFVAGDQASRVTAYAYPTSPHASRAKHGQAESTAKRMIDRELAYKFRGYPDIVAQYDARNWAMLASVEVDQLNSASRRANTMNKFTPGPWAKSYVEGNCHIGREGAAIGIAIVPDAHLTEQQDNGALIVAAPDLFRALDAAKVALTAIIDTRPDDMPSNLVATLIAARDEAAAVLVNAVGEG